MKTEIFYGDPMALNWDSGIQPGSPVRVQLSPFGEFTLRDGGKRSGVTQHCSKSAFEAMVANWKAMGARDILVDVDHASATGGSTEAAAWAKNLRVEDDGLCADFELTPRGRELVEGKSYRFVSPGWTLADDGTPIALCSVALTNRPNLPVKPVVNAGFDESKHPRAEDGKFSSGGGGSIRSKADAMRGSAEREVRATAQDGARLDLGTLNDELKASRYWVKKGSRAEDRAGGIARRKAAHRLAIMAGYKYNRSTGLYE